MAKITGIIRDQIKKFEQDKITIVEGWNFNQKQTLRRIELYYNSKFETGSFDGLDYFDDERFKKFFYNINQFPCDIEAKATDIDTKDFVMIPEEPDDEVSTYFLSREFSQWVKEKKWGQILNRITWNRPKYGTVVVKKVKDRIEVVNLHDLINDQSVEALWQGPVFQRYVMTPEELRAMPNYDKTAVEALISRAGDKDIVVYDGYLYANYSDVYDKKSKDEQAYFKCVVGGIEDCEYDAQNNITFDGSQVLFSSEIKAPTKDNPGDFPYRETHRRRIPGRWLGVGKVEELFDPQIRMNELENLKSKALNLTSTILLQSEDDTLAKNVLTDLVNGDILKVKSPISQIPMVQQNMGGFQQEEQRWDKNIQERSWSFEAETGESMPSGTPFRLGALLAQKSGGFFALQREDVALFLIDVFFELIVPNFKKDKKKRHVITLPPSEENRDKFVDSYVEWLVAAKLDGMTFDEAVNFDIEAYRTSLKQKFDRRPFVEIPDSFYDNVKFKMKLVITDEQIDMGQKLETLSNILQIIMSNPQALQNPDTRKVLFAAMEYAGVNPFQLGIGQAPQPTQMPQGMPQNMPQGMPNVPMMANQSTQVNA